MSSIEDRLRDALAATAEAARVPEHHALPEPHRRGRLKPVAVVAAIVAIVTGAVLIRPGSGPAQHTTPRSSTTRLSTKGSSLPSAPYFVYIASDDTSLVVANASTGATMSTFAAPAGTTWDTDSATAQPLVFFAAAYQNHSPSGEDLTNLYRITLTSAGRMAAMTRVATVNAGKLDLQAAAGSPDGTQIAFPFNGPSSGNVSYGPAQIDVLDVASGHTTAYRTTMIGRVSGLTWSDDGKRLAWQAGGTSGGKDGVWVLTLGVDHDLTSASRFVMPASAIVTDGSAVLSGDGKDVFYLAITSIAGTDHVAVMAADAGTGAVRGAVFVEPFVPGDESVNADEQTSLFARSGNELLVVDGAGRTYRIDLATGRSTVLPTAVENAQGIVLAW